MTERETGDGEQRNVDQDASGDPLSDFSVPGDADLHVAGDASGADGKKIAEPASDEDSAED
ncbi:hypothetical protein C5C66_07540 [Rathayibacter toxicus]|uniref:Uncharacterized protein n=1 Tax=Rathayibacter toxicus TaxID=145458 RepID=A0A0C5BT57_9MICO|nr:hypothetical protein [Rathayibacter toxicus]AJM77862.1 hypothetical protein TI83_07695 [Rathayibacter toxicus]ALS57946.1 hypothetical protein APU90_09380 [Rathayibacter toxicus]KKM44337.1 hypothetical protein VT73_10645 [Rathayibacter toxicus]PPG20370.1 hypothetical protein C5D15_07540 [Rathayibacter toxicus]PPG45471.1 hypothetical protein C5D16_07505 [Rathayibacter toxicus]